MEDCTDDLLLQALQQYEYSLELEDEPLELEPRSSRQSEEVTEQGSDEDHDLLTALLDYEKSVASNEELPSKAGTGRFAEPVTEADILSNIHEAIPKSTRKTTDWAVKTWKDWAESRKIRDSEDYPPLLDHINNEDLCRWMSRFVFEARNQEGGQYPGGTLYSLCSGIQRYVRDKRTSCGNEGVLDIYKDSSFAFFRKSFDSVLKGLHSSGIGTKRKRAELISENIEDRLWEEGSLGDSSPQQLLDTLVYCLGLNLALRSGKEHRDLRPDMFELIQEPYSDLNLLYTESGSKNHTGGLNDRKVANKTVKIFGNLENPKRCVITLYKKYMSLRPKGAPSDVFYLKPLNNPLPDCWYTCRPVGHNLLSQTVKRLCSNIGIEGHYTNHSLRRTCATRLFHKGIDEQQIMSVTGHRSTDAVRIYKSISHDQEQVMSKIIQNRKEESQPKTKENKENEGQEANNPNMFNFSNCNVVIHNK